ncbi:MAG: putative DNA binding domain-containing protein [Deltaproteobacteria bacterium]|nr:putative DNA binding domain-containing protein [Deltaproteobacteria bacterium]
MIDLESELVERKASLVEGDKIRQAICAFANDLPNAELPGTIFIGVNDNGTCSNLLITDELLRTLSDMRSDGNILPFPIMSVEKKLLNGCDVAVVEVKPSYNTPVRYKGRIWIRVGPRRAIASSDEERMLVEKRLTGNLPFDQNPVTGTTIEDLDMDFFKQTYLPSAVAADVLAQNQRTVVQQLSSLRFLTKEGIPNVSSVIVLGKDPLSWIPGAYIQFLRLDGKDLTDPIRHQKKIIGNLYNQLRLLDDILDANISVATDVKKSSTEIRQPDYPIVALQQIVRNAVLHRTYESTNSPVKFYWFSDRIEIYNPGGLYGNVNKQNFGHGATDYRNPMIAEAMKVMGFVQRFGMGIPLAYKELEKNGNPEPEFRFESNGVLAIIRKI